MAFPGLILTNKGRALQAKAQAGATLHFNRIGVGDGDLGSQQISDLNALVSEKKSLAITKLKTQSGGKAIVGGVLSNQDVAVGFYFRELGVFAQDPDLGEILYCYSNAGAGAEYIPAAGGDEVVEKSIDIISLIGNAATITADVPSGIYALAEDLGQPNGIATLGADGKVPASQLNVSSTADKITTVDAGGYYTGTDVEAALQEIGQALNGTRGNIIASVNSILNM